MNIDNQFSINKSEKPDFKIKKLGKCEINSPLKLNDIVGDCVANFVDDNEKILFDPSYSYWKKCIKNSEEPLTIELAGPRKKIFYDPQKTKVAIVTCGGLCPGLNDVIRSLVMECWYHYGIRKIIGIKFGYLGLIIDNKNENITLTPDMVAEINRDGGSFLGSSRGPQDVKKMVDYLVSENINILFTIGGDGTQKGALAIVKEITARKLNISVIGIPKTIDNDIAYIDKTFGFETASAVAKDVLIAAHNEARGYLNGIGLVKLMGRNAGFIAARAALAASEANFVLVPEIDFDLEGENGLLIHLESRLRRKKHALIVVAEGAGQSFLEKEREELGIDPSGHKRLADIGIFLKDKIVDYFKKIKDLEISLKYIDPSYYIRSAPANASDQVYCLALGQNAVHAAMSGRTAMIVGSWHGKITHVPINIAISKRKVLSPESFEWLSVLEATGQPASMTNRCI